jgi:hypothetical protein
MVMAGGRAAINDGGRHMGHHALCHVICLTRQFELLNCRVGALLKMDFNLETC